MSKTSEVLKANQTAGKGSLIGYFPAGYPTLDESVEAAIAMCKSGIDVLELGVPLLQQLQCARVASMFLN